MSTPNGLNHLQHLATVLSDRERVLAPLGSGTALHLWGFGKSSFRVPKFTSPYGIYGLRVSHSEALTGQTTLGFRFNTSHSPGQQGFNTPNSVLGAVIMSVGTEGVRISSFEGSVGKVKMGPGLRTLAEPLGGWVVGALSIPVVGNERPLLLPTEADIEPILEFVECGEPVFFERAGFGPEVTILDTNAHEQPPVALAS